MFKKLNFAGKIANKISSAVKKKEKTTKKSVNLDEGIIPKNADQNTKNTYELFLNELK